jgi:hypothetical protein
MLAHVRALLAPGGRLWLETPNIDSYGYREFGPHWRGLEAPRHLVMFGPRSLEIALRRAGFAAVTVLPPTDPSLYTLTCSAIIENGGLSERVRAPYSQQVRRRAAAAMRAYRSAVERDPRCSEFLTVEAA